MNCLYFSHIRVIMSVIGICCMGVFSVAYGETEKNAKDSAATKMTNHRTNSDYIRVNRYFKNSGLTAIQGLDPSSLKHFSSEERRSLYISNHRPLRDLWKTVAFNVVVGFGVGSYIQGNIRGGIASTVMNTYILASIVLLDRLQYYIAGDKNNSENDKARELVAVNIITMAIIIFISDRLYSAIDSVFYVKRYNKTLSSLLLYDILEPDQGGFNFEIDSSPVPDRMGYRDEKGWHDGWKESTYRLMYEYRF